MRGAVTGRAAERGSVSCHAERFSFFMVKDRAGLQGVQRLLGLYGLYYGFFAV